MVTKTDARTTYIGPNNLRLQVEPTTFNSMSPSVETDVAFVGRTFDHLKTATKVFNPFYSPSIIDDGDAAYQFAQYKVCSLLWGCLA